MLFYRHVSKRKTNLIVNKRKSGPMFRRGAKPRKATVGPIETVVVFLRLVLVTATIAVLLVSPLLLWEFVWYGVLPALAGHGDAGMYTEGHEIANGDGVRVIALILLAVPPFTLAYTLPGALDRIMRSRLGAGAAESAGPAAGDDDTVPDTVSRTGLGGDIVQVSLDGDVTPYGIPEQGFSWDDK